MVSRLLTTNELTMNDAGLSRLK